MLFWGILGALVLRAVFIALGAVLLSRFHWIGYLFGAFLVFTGIKLLVQRSGEVHPILVSLGVIVALLAGSIVASLLWPPARAIPAAVNPSPEKTLTAGPEGS